MPIANVAWADADDIQAWNESPLPHVILDVRERGEYALGHVPGACPVPRGLIEILAPALFPWRQVPVIVYSNEDHRASLAAATLTTSLGYTDVRVLRGGVSAWTLSRRQLEEGVNVIGKRYGERVATRDGVRQLNPDQVAELIDGGQALVLDARTTAEYERGHIPGAFNVPGGELPATLMGLPPSRIDGKTIIVHCAGRTRSIIGAKLVMDLGLAPVFALRNGTMAWRMSGRELEYARRNLEYRPVPDGELRARSYAERFVAGTGARAWSAAEVRRLIHGQEPLYVLDVRLPHEYEAERITGALSCPAGQIANAADEVLVVRGARILCYSNGDTRSRVAAGLLSRIGYPDVGWIEGGLAGWRAGRGPTTSGRPASYPEDLDQRVASAALVSAEDLSRELGSAAPPTVLDVRRSSEFALGHIVGSRWVPRGDFERRVAARADPAARVVLVSDRGVRAALAAETAASLGYASARVLAGGAAGWAAAGYPLVQGLEGAEVSLREAKEDAELVAPRPRMLERNVEDMVRYLDWEEKLA